VTGTKTCRSCGADKSPNEFRKRGDRDALRPHCRTCEAQMRADRRVRNQPDAPVVPEPSYPKFWPVTSAGPWTRDANCRGKDPDLFFPTRGERTQPAKDICASCPVRLQCLEYALANQEGFGVWGGLSAKQRQRILIRRNAERRGQVAS
jgi:WhiB family redox-sensing transcriptional regulator